MNAVAPQLIDTPANRGTAPPDRRRRFQVALASLQLSLARRRGNLAGVVEQVRFLAAPVTGQSDEDIALDSDLRAVALMNLGTVEAWSLALPDAERHLREGAALARQIGRPYLEVCCLAQVEAYLLAGLAGRELGDQRAGCASTKQPRGSRYGQALNTATGHCSTNDYRRDLRHLPP